MMLQMNKTPSADITDSAALHCLKEVVTEFLEAIPKHYMVAVGTHGFCKATNEFAIIDKNGIVKTYYRPKRGIREYYDDRRKHR